MSFSVSRHFYEGMAGISLLTALPNMNKIIPAILPWAHAQVPAIFLRDTVASDWPSSQHIISSHPSVDCLANQK